MAAGCPMLIDKVVPGQEEGNAERIEALGAGRRVAEPALLGREIAGLLEGGGARWKAMRRAAYEGGVPDAAHRVARLALELAGRKLHATTTDR